MGKEGGERGEGRRREGGEYRKERGRRKEMRNGSMCVHVHVHKGVMPTEAKTVFG